LRNRRAATSCGASFPGIDEPFGKTPRADRRWKRSGREVSANSTVGPQFGWEAVRAWRPALQIRCGLKRTFDRTRRCFRKAYNLPYRRGSPTASCHLTLIQIQPMRPNVNPTATLRRAPQSSIVTTPCRPLLASGAAGLVDRAYPSYEARLQGRAWEISTQNHRPHIAMSYNLNVAWKASLTRTPPLICAFAPGSQTALIRKTTGRRERLRDTTCLVSRNENDSAGVPQSQLRVREVGRPLTPATARF
jgi:hypothetical protein